MWYATIYRRDDRYRLSMRQFQEVVYVLDIPFHEYDRTPGWDGAEQAAIDLAQMVGGDDVQITYAYGYPGE